MVTENNDDNRSNRKMASIEMRLQVMASQIEKLLNSEILRFDNRCRRTFPVAHGIYRIFDLEKFNETIRAGRTKTAAEGLQQRLYRNHLMGDQEGNLRTQLVNDGLCPNIEVAKRFIRDQLAVQVLVVDDRDERTWLEHFMLGVLRPKYSD